MAQQLLIPTELPASCFKVGARIQEVERFQPVVTLLDLGSGVHRTLVGGEE